MPVTVHVFVCICNLSLSTNLTLCISLSVCVSCSRHPLQFQYIHVSACYRALDQKRARGLTAEELEFWVENCVQLCKSTIKHRYSKDPEKLLVNSLLCRHALAVVKRYHGYRDGQLYVGTFDERVPEYRNAALDVSVADDGDDVTHTQSLGLGQNPAIEEWPGLLGSLQKAVQDYPRLWQDRFGSLVLEQCCITMFKRAQIRSGELVLSEAYEHPKYITSRFSHFVVVEFESEGLFVAKVKYFVKVEVTEQEGPAEVNGQPLRYAIADLYRQRTPSRASSDVGECFMVTKQQQQHPSHSDYPVNMEDIIAKVLWAEAALCADNVDHGFPSEAWCLVWYPHFQCYVDPRADVDDAHEIVRD